MVASTTPRNSELLDVAPVLGERPRDARDAAHPVGQPFLVLEDQTDDLADADGGDRQIVGAQVDAEQADQQREQRREQRRDQEPDHEVQAEATEMEGARAAGEDRRGIGADRPEAGDADVELAGKAPLHVEAEAHHGVDPGQRQEEDQKGEQAAELHHLPRSRPVGRTIRRMTIRAKATAGL